jgi:RND family efflux transporter MFP subunit
LSAKAAVDAYEESIHGLERNVEVARLQVGYSQIEAPFPGIVTKRSADPGDLAVPGKAILTIQQPSPVKLVVQVPQELIGRMGPGSKLLLNNGLSTLQVSVTKVYPALGKNLLGSVEAVLPKSPFGLPTGSTVAVDIVTAAAAGVIVPESAVFRTEKGAFVYTVSDGTVHAREVEVIGFGDGKAVVKGGVVPGTQVAVAQENKLLTLAEGMKITTAGGKQ